MAHKQYPQIGSEQLQKNAVTPRSMVLRAKCHRMRTAWFKLGSGDGATSDDVLTIPSYAISLIGAQIIYVDEDAEVVAGGNIRIGTTVGGEEVCAPTAYRDSAVVGSTTPLVLNPTSIPPGGMLTVRHTGVSPSQNGSAVVEVEYTADQ